MRVYLGKQVPFFGIKELEQLQKIELNLSEFLNHTFICGSAHSGKTILGKAIIEDFTQSGIPAIIIDNKGDMGSLGLVFPNYSPESFISWVDSGEGKEEIKAQAASYSKRYLHRLKLFDISPAAVKAMMGNTRTTIFTPKSNHGVKISVPALPEVPLNIDEIMKKDPDLITQSANSIAVGIVERIYPGENMELYEREFNFLSNLISYGWQKKQRIEGIDGIKVLVDLIQRPPAKMIGAFPMDRYIMPHKRKTLALKLNSLLIADEHLWYSGLPLDMDTLLGTKVPKPKTQISIINVTHLERVEEQSYVIGRVIQTIYSWMKQLGPTKNPRLLFYIDEVGKHGINRSLFPKAPNYTAAKYMLNQLLLSAKKYGVAVVASATTPGNLDYKAMSACQNWLIGPQNNNREWQNMRYGLLDVNLKVEQLARDNNLAREGEFILKLSNGETRYLHERWITSFHRSFSILDMKRFTEENEFDQTSSFTKEIPSESNQDTKTSAYETDIKASCSLEILSGELQGQKVSLKSGENSYGRNELCPSNNHVSRRHIRIIKKDDDFYIKDTSTNGTFIGGRKIDIRRLEPGDEITLGKGEIKFRYLK